MSKAHARVNKDNDQVYYHRPPLDIPEGALPAGKRVLEAAAFAVPEYSPLATGPVIAALAKATASAASAKAEEVPPVAVAAVAFSVPEAAAGGTEAPAVTASATLQHPPASAPVGAQPAAISSPPVAEQQNKSVCCT